MNGQSNGASGSIPLWIAGKEVTTSTTFDVVSPATGKTLWQSSSISAKQAVEAVEAAEKAFKTWKKAKPAEVRTILLKAADILDERAKEISSYMMEETGALEAFTGFNMVVAAENFRDVAGRAANIQGVIPQTGTPGQAAFIFKEPFGVNFGISPWNAPIILGVRAFLYAIAAGNTVILKGSELCPKTFWALGSVMKQAGLPDGVLSVIYHQTSDAAAVANAIIEHPFVRKVNFTGSTATGSIIASKAGKGG